MGNISYLERSSNSQTIDYLNFTYKGNQISAIMDDYASQDLNSLKEYQDINGNSQDEMSYDSNGNLIKDLDRDILTIQYNLLNLPELVQFRNGNQIRNTYDASGRKLETEYFTLLSSLPTPIDPGEVCDFDNLAVALDRYGTAYVDNFEYNIEDGDEDTSSLVRIYNPEGYIEDLTNCKYYYYRKDHLGNNREVWLANTNSVIQKTQYYPSGLPFAYNAGDNPGIQNKKYNSKEFIEMHGFDTYDYSARMMYPAIGGRFMTVDPLCEKYYWISPYAYCMNNPVRFVDPDGRIVKPASGSTPEFINNYNIANNILQTRGIGGSISQLIKSNEVYYVQESSKSFYDAANKTINWNTSLGLEVDGKVVLSPTGILAHELEHARNHDDAIKSWYSGDFNKFYDWQAGLAENTSDNYNKKEEENVIAGPEQSIAIALESISENETTRDAYVGKTVRVDGINSTSKPQQLNRLEPKTVYILIKKTEPKQE